MRAKNAEALLTSSHVTHLYSEIAMLDPEVPPSATAAMLDLQHCICRGYRFYVTGIVPLEKVQALVQRFAERYELSAGKDRRHYLRKSGIARFNLVLFPRPGETAFQFWLLKTEGDDPLASMERWRDAHADCLPWIWRYELVRLPVPVGLQKRYRKPLEDPREARRTQRIRPVTWTWRFTAQAMDAIRARIRSTVQRPDAELEQLLHGLKTTPGFRGNRDQLRQLFYYVVEQSKRAGRPLPALPKTIRWVRPMQVACVPLSALVRRHRRGAPTWFAGHKP